MNETDARRHLGALAPKEILDIKTLKGDMKNLATQISEIKRITRRRLQVAQARNQEGHPITKAKYHPGRNLTSNEGSKLALLRCQYTFLCIVRAMHRGRFHLPQGKWPHYARHINFCIRVMQIHNLYKRLVIPKKAMEYMTKHSPEKAEIAKKVLDVYDHISNSAKGKAGLLLNKVGQ